MQSYVAISMPLGSVGSQLSFNTSTASTLTQTFPAISAGVPPSPLLTSSQSIVESVSRAGRTESLPQKAYVTLNLPPSPHTLSGPVAELPLGLKLYLTQCNWL